MSPELTFQPALEIPLTALSRLFALAFQGYFVTVPDDPKGLAARVRQEQIDLAASCAVWAGAESVGVIFMARRGSVSRVAGMGITPDWRGKGASGSMMQRIISDARARGEARVLLEVIEQNTPAVKLYHKHGFQVTRRLVGYETANLQAVNASLQQIPLEEAQHDLQRYSAADLSWQLRPTTLAGVTLPAQAFRLADATAIVNVLPGTVAIRAIVVPPEQRRQGQGRMLLHALAHHFPNHKFTIPAIVPQTLADDFFLKLGFGHSAISQFEMVCPLN